MYFTYSEYTSAGLKRQNNQDSIFSSAKDDFGLFIVADGMGGHFGGEIASGMLKTAFSEWWNSFDGETEFDECCEQIKKIIEETNAAIYNQYSSQGKICGTTLALLFFYKDRYLLINTGDSRIYSYCRGKLRQESVDHVFSEEKKITGELTADEIAEHRNKNKLTSAIGCKKNFKMNIRTAPYNKKTTFFMCSDGVYKLCNDKFIKRAVGMKNSDAMTETLKNNIETNGATDNFSFIKIACAEKNEGEVFMKSKLKIIIPIAIAITAIILAFIFIQFKPEETQVEADPLDIAQSYLVEQSYEQAIAEFKKVIELDPMNVDAYIGIAEAYEAMGDIDSAVEWLKKGYEFTGDGRILDYLNRLKAIVETTAVTEENTTVIETMVSEMEETNTVTETTTLSVEELEIEAMREQALEILDPFVPDKDQGEPNSVVYAYYGKYGGADTPYSYECFRCTYDENGKILKEENVQYIMYLGVFNGNIIEYNPYSSKMFDRLNDGNYAACTSGGQYSSGLDTWYNTIKHSEIIKMSDIYEIDDGYNVFKIYTENNYIFKIENNYGEYTEALEFDDLQQKWVYLNNNVTPYKIGLPDGLDESIFDIEDKIVKVFDDADEYFNYVN